VELVQRHAEADVCDVTERRAIWYVKSGQSTLHRREKTHHRLEQAKSISMEEEYAHPHMVVVKEDIWRETRKNPPR
jgi:hypothetical protein